MHLINKKILGRDMLAFTKKLPTLTLCTRSIRRCTMACWLNTLQQPFSQAKYFFLILMLLVVSPYSRADFDYPGHGHILNTIGEQQPLNFGFSFLEDQGEYSFSLGKHKMKVTDVPKRYTLELVLSQDNLVWVTDFSSAPLTGFVWQIGPHHLRLAKEPATAARAGEYKLTVDGTHYFFTSKKRGQIHFLFTETGIAEIRVESLLMPKR